MRELRGIKKARKKAAPKKRKVNACARCGAEVWWGVSAAGGRVCVDEEPVPDGDVVSVMQIGPNLVEPYDPQTHGRARRYSLHSKTCTNPARRRAPQPRQELLL